MRGLAHDVLLISGGVSAGVLDLVPGVLADLGVEQVFHKVNLKPGKPLWFGVRKSPRRPTLVFGLPGNPVSSLVCFELFVRPAIGELAGARRRDGSTEVDGALASPFKQRVERPTYHPARLSTHGGTGSRSRPLRWHGSGDLRTLVEANALAYFPPGGQAFAAATWCGCCACRAVKPADPAVFELATKRSGQISAAESTLEVWELPAPWPDPIARKAAAAAKPLDGTAGAWWQSTWALAAAGNVLLVGGAAAAALEPAGLAGAGALGAVGAAGTLDGRRPYVVIWLTSFCFWLAAFYWLTLPHWATSFGWLALSAYLAFYLPVFVGLAAWPCIGLRCRRSWPRRWFGSGWNWPGPICSRASPWPRWRTTQYRWPLVIQITDIFGSYGVSFLIMLVAAAGCQDAAVGQ